MMRVKLSSYTDEYDEWLKSIDTSGSELYPRIPDKLVSEAVLII